MSFNLKRLSVTQSCQRRFIAAVFSNGRVVSCWAANGGLGSASFVYLEKMIIFSITQATHKNTHTWNRSAVKPPGSQEKELILITRSS